MEILLSLNSSVFAKSPGQGILASFESNRHTSSWSGFITLHTSACEFSKHNYLIYPFPFPGPLPRSLTFLVAPGLSCRFWIVKGVKTGPWVGIEGCLLGLVIPKAKKVVSRRVLAKCVIISYLIKLILIGHHTGSLGYSKEYVEIRNGPPERKGVNIIIAWAEDLLGWISRESFH